MEDIKQIFLEYEKEGSYERFKDQIIHYFNRLQLKPQEVIEERIETLKRALNVTHQGYDYYNRIDMLIDELEELKSMFYIHTKYNVVTVRY